MERYTLKVNNSPFTFALCIDGNSIVEMNGRQLINFQDFPTIDLSISTVNLYGIPEHADHFYLTDTTNDRPYRLYNCDRYLWPLLSKAGLYGSSPFFVSHSEDMTAGFYWRNASETYFDIKMDKKGRNSEVLITSECNSLDLIVWGSQKIEEFFTPYK